MGATVVLGEQRRGSNSRNGALIAQVSDRNLVEYGVVCVRISRLKGWLIGTYVSARGRNPRRL